MSTPPVPEPKKYIRTLERDKAVLEKGGVPDLVPFDVQPTPSVPASTATVSVAASEPAPPPPFPAFRPADVIPPPISPIPHIVVRSSPSPLPPPPPPPPTPPPQLPPPPPPLPPPAPELPEVLKTYSGDFSKRLEKTKASAATVLASEQDARREPVRLPEKSTKSSVTYVIAGIILLITGVAGSLFAYNRYVKNVSPVIIAPTPIAPIFVDEYEDVFGVGPELFKAIKTSLARNLNDGSVRLLSYEPTTSNVFLALQLPAPDVLLRNINSSAGMAGVVQINGVNSPFFILSATSYSDTFAGMLQWEPSMARDLSELFPPNAATAAALSVPAQFVDEVISNRDTRVHRDALGESILLYGYWNRNTLIIARNPKSFTEIINRLSTFRIKNR